MKNAEIRSICKRLFAFVAGATHFHQVHQVLEFGVLFEIDFDRGRFRMLCDHAGLENDFISMEIIEALECD